MSSPSENLAIDPAHPSLDSGRQDMDQGGIAAANALVATGMRQVDQVITQSLQSDVVLINQIADYIIGSGGKRLRPMIHLLSAAACADRSAAAQRDQQTQVAQQAKLAAIIEFIHTATLLHDDVVDESDLRRGQQTANAVWGNAASVLVGDFLYSRAFQMMVDIDSMRVMEILAETTNVIAEGEVLQLLHLRNPETTEAGYREVIRCKTAKLFQAAAQLGAVVNGSDQRLEAALAEYGLQLGTAFQLADDMLDYTGAADQLGKNVGDDLAEGKPTLPLIHVLHHGDPAQRQLIRQVITDGGREQLDAVIDAIHSTDALAYTRAQAVAAADAARQALTALPQSAYTNALTELTVYAIERSN